MTLGELRDLIDALDEEVVRAVARRAKVVRQIAALKRVTGAPARDPAREAVIYDRARAAGRAEGLDDASTDRVVDVVLSVCWAARHARHPLEREVDETTAGSGAGS